MTQLLKLPFKLKTQPMSQQWECLRLALGREYFAYFMEQGTGKTKVLLDEAAYFWTEGKIDALLVIAPKGCYLNWQKEEIPKHLSDDIVHKVVAWSALSGQSKKKKKALEIMKDVQLPYLKIMLFNTEALSHKPTFDYLSDFMRKNKTLVAIDESTSIKTPGSKRCMYARRLGKMAPFRRIMTGTPIADKPLDIYGQAAFLQGHNPLGFPTFQAFKCYFANILLVKIGMRSIPQITGYRFLDQLSKELSQFSYRVLKKDCLDLPPKVYQTRYIEPSKEQKRLYNDMAEKMLAEIEDGRIATSKLALTKLMRLHSICCGHLKLDDGTQVHIPNNRLESLMDILEETSGKVIIWCYYQEDVKLITERIRKDYGKESVIDYYGGTSDEDRAEAKRRFTEDPALLYWVGTAKTGGAGITLVEASTVVYYSQGYGLESRLQSEDRNHRIGQEQSCTYIDLLMPKTVDEKIVAAVKEKKSLADTIMGNLKSYFQTIDEDDQMPDEVLPE